MKSFSSEYVRMLVSIGGSILAGALAGAAAGSLAAAPYRTDLCVSGSSGTGTNTSSTAANASSTSPVVSATSTPASSTPDIRVVSIERKSPDPILPPDFSARRMSSVAGVYRRTSSPTLSDADLLGEAVAVTSDGWFVVPSTILGNAKIGDIVLWTNGTAASATRAVLDERASVVYLKTDRTNVSAPAFARYEAVARGLPVWVERRTGSYEPAFISALFEETGNLNGVSSRAPMRRIIITGVARAGDSGAPVWDTRGTLIGIISAKPGESLTVIPASAWAPSLYGIFSDGKILHADLGVRSVDLSALRLADRSSLLPERGAWIVPDKIGKLPAVEKDGPAAKAGIREGDVIVSVDRDILDGSADFAEALVQYKPGSEVTLGIVRDGADISIHVTLGSVPMSKELK